jgi:HK97 family phage portal protein
VGLFPNLEKRFHGQVTANSDAGWIPLSAEGTSKPLDDETALAVPAVYTCVSIIANNIAALPIDVYTKSKGKRKEVGVPLYLRLPNQAMTPFEFKFRVATSLLIDGNSYVYVLRDEKGKVLELTPLHPDRVEVKRDSKGGKYFIVDGVEENPMRSDEIIHTLGFVTAGSLTGVSPLYATNTMNIAHSAEAYSADFYQNGASMQGVIEIPAKPGKPIAPEELERMKREFTARHRGRNGYAVGALSDGATWKPITLSPVDAQLIESRKYTATQITGMYHVPAYIVDPNVTSTWGSGIAEQNTNFVQKTLVPWIIRIEESFSAHLLQGSQYMKLNVSALLRGSDKEQAEIFHKAITDGWMTRNEVRQLREMEPLPGLDEPLVMLNMASDQDNTEKIQAQIAALEAQVKRLSEGGSNE